MTDSQGTGVRLKVSPQVAGILRAESRDARLCAARGESPLSGGDLLTALAFLIAGSDEELRKEALRTLKNIPCADLLPMAADPQLHPQLLDLLGRARQGDVAVMEALVGNPSAAPATIARLATRAEGKLLSRIADDARLCSEPQVVEALLANPHADPALLRRLRGEVEESPSSEEEREEESEEEIDGSKYQQALDMQVADKIKRALTGDKEWRAIFLKDPNKLVSSAVLKNPRITDGEVLAVAKNKSSNDELIRLITLNQEWIKNYEVQKSLVSHPRTPLPKALRYMNVLTIKDLKHLAKSKGVNQVIVNNARRLLLAKDQNR